MFNVSASVVVNAAVFVVGVGGDGAIVVVVVGERGGGGSDGGRDGCWGDV